MEGLQQLFGETVLGNNQVVKSHEMHLNFDVFAQFIQKYNNPQVYAHYQQAIQARTQKLKNQIFELTL